MHGIASFIFVIGVVHSVVAQGRERTPDQLLPIVVVVDGITSSHTFQMVDFYHFISRQML